MRVLHLVETTRGATGALHQVSGLRALGVNVVVGLPSTQTGLAPEYSRTGAVLIQADLAFMPGPQLVGRVRRFRTLVDRAQPDVIHSHSLGTTLLARVALGRRHPLPRVFHVPRPLHLAHRSTRALDLVTAGPHDHWIASCRATEDEYLRHGVPRERISLSYYGTDVERLARGMPRGTVRHELGVAADAPLLGMVAHIYGPQRVARERRGIKGHEDFIDAVEIVRRIGQPVRAVVVGEAWRGAEAYARRLRAYAWRRCGGAIRFMGHRDDVPAVYADLDVAVHPSLSESCGGAVESLAAACPTVATRVGGLPEVVIDGETGWLVPPRSPERLAAAVLDAMTHPAEALRRAQAGQALVRRQFSIERTAAEVLAIYRRLLGVEEPEERMAI